MNTTTGCVLAGSGREARWRGGILPALRDARSGETHLVLDADGLPAAQHSFDGVPEDWIVERDEEGRALALHPSIQAGYWRGAEFMALAEVLSPTPDA